MHVPKNVPDEASCPDAWIIYPAHCRHSYFRVSTLHCRLSAASWHFTKLRRGGQGPPRRLTWALWGLPHVLRAYYHSFALSFARHWGPPHLAFHPTCAWLDTGLPHPRVAMFGLPCRCARRIGHCSSGEPTAETSLHPRPPAKPAISHSAAHKSAASSTLPGASANKLLPGADRGDPQHPALWKDLELLTARHRRARPPTPATLS